MYVGPYLNNRGKVHSEPTLYKTNSSSSCPCLRLLCSKDVLPGPLPPPATARTRRRVEDFNLWSHCDVETRRWSERTMPSPSAATSGTFTLLSLRVRLTAPAADRRTRGSLTSTLLGTSSRSGPRINQTLGVIERFRTVQKIEHLRVL